MHLVPIYLLAWLSATAIALPHTSPHVLHEKRDVPHKKWVKRDRLESHIVLPMRIGMTQRNLEKGYDLLMEVSSHDSPKYGQHYTADEVHEIFAPAKETVDAIRAWLEFEGIAPHRISISGNKQWVQLDAKVHEAERLFKAQYHNYEHTASGMNHVACDEYHIPEHLSSHVDYITPGLKLLATRNRPRVDRQKRQISKRGGAPFLSGPVRGPNITLPARTSKAAQLAMCDSQVGPACIQAFYNITLGTTMHHGNSLAIFEEGDYYDKESLVLFFEQFDTPSIPVFTEPYNRGIDGGIPNGDANVPVDYPGESDLDLQISYPIIWPQNSFVFQTDDVDYATGVKSNGNGFLNTFFDAIDGSYCNFTAFGETGNSPIDPTYPDPPAYTGPLQCGVWQLPPVISISYGEQEDDLPASYQQSLRRQCLEIMKLGMRGTTVLIASGDAGVATGASDDGNSDGCLGATGKVFDPDFPATCPYVLSVGATYLPPGANYKTDSEIAVTRFPSGGGFSNIYPRPKYQNKTLTAYFKNYDPGYPYYQTQGQNNPNATITGTGIYNRAGRGYPDVSAIGDNVIIYLDGTPQLIGGTSASTPVWGAILTRINEERITHKKSKIGFVNPVLYAHPQVFHDITNGTNAGCGTQGFSCVKGWDPVTGFGTPNYPALLKLFLSLP